MYRVVFSILNICWSLFWLRGIVFCEIVYYCHHANVRLPYMNEYMWIYMNWYVCEWVFDMVYRCMCVCKLVHVFICICLLAFCSLGLLSLSHNSNIFIIAMKAGQLAGLKAHTHTYICVYIHLHICMYMGSVCAVGNIDLSTEILLIKCQWVRAWQVGADIYVHNVSWYGII